MKVMRAESPQAYRDAAFSQIPRILSLQDRNPFSKTYGCFHRNFWFHRTSDFPSAINQMGVHSLALIWSQPFDNNPYYQNPQILEWCLAGIRFWIKCQHKDGSFDEWYPNERGWAGPTGYLVHAMADTYFILKDAFPEELRPDFINAIRRAGHYLIAYDEEFVLANHHAIALLPIYEAYLIVQEEALLKGFHRKFAEFEKYCYSEGWSLEYDGVDIGYLSGTISFLSRLYKHWPDKRIAAIVEKAVGFTSYHLYPHGYFGGAMGSRETAHFYHFGYEFWASQLPLAAKMARTGLEFLEEGKLVSPGTQEDHYVLYRISEYLEAYLAWKPKRDGLPLLPWEGPDDFEKFFSQAGIYVRKKGNTYLVVNLNKGGVVKAFDIPTRRLVCNDAGWMAQLANGKAVTSRWNDPQHKVNASDSKDLHVSGAGQYMVSKIFSPQTMILFRIFMLLFGWNAPLAYHIKALIRRILMVGARRAPMAFERSISWQDNSLTVIDKISLEGDTQVRKIYMGDELPVRYVPQSRYFQAYELDVFGQYLSSLEIEELNRNKTIQISRQFSLKK